VTLRPRELLDVAREVAAALAGRAVQKVVQPDAHTVLLGFSTAWLQIVVSQRGGRIHLVDERPPGTGEAAPAFCMLLRKLLVGARLSSVEAVDGERACALDFSRSDGNHRLLVLLYGAGARLILVDASGHPLGAIGPGKKADALPPPRADDQPSRFPSSETSAAIAAHYAALEERTTVEQARSQAVAAARRTVEKLRRRSEALRGDLEKVALAADRRHHADLLLAHKSEIAKGAREVSLPNDFSDGKPVTIALDPARSAADNAARLYKEHKRMARARGAIEARISDGERALAEAEQALARAEAGEAPPLAATAKPSRGKERQAPRPPFKRFRSSTGVEILVGRGAAKNDELTFHVARGNDLWLHTRDFPGAHVVVPLAGRPVDGETLLDAATLAVHHSPARTEASADVSYTPRKLVRKPKGAPPGKVSVAGAKTLHVRMEPERLRRLLATEDASK
jgi:predicted ribosome quality control (RQC) complex YloA/Tae2 family protein